MQFFIRVFIVYGIDGNVVLLMQSPFPLIFLWLLLLTVWLLPDDTVGRKFEDWCHATAIHPTNS